MLNATENEVDVEGLSTEGVKLEFDANNDEVATWGLLWLANQ